MNNKSKEPKHFLVFRILAFSLLFVGILLIILGCVIFRVKAFVGDGTDVNFALLMPGLFVCLFSCPCFFIGFMPKINKMSIESVKYMQQSNKNNLSDIATTSADIASGAITNVVKSVKNGIKETKLCKHCGEEIDLDSKFCKNCGKEQ